MTPDLLAMVRPCLSFTGSNPRSVRELLHWRQHRLMLDAQPLPRIHLPSLLCGTAPIYAVGERVPHAVLAAAEAGLD